MSLRSPLKGPTASLARLGCASKFFSDSPSSPRAPRQQLSSSARYSPKARWKSFGTFGACDLGKMSTGKNLRNCLNCCLKNKRFFPVAFFLDHTLQTLRNTSSGTWVLSRWPEPCQSATHETYRHAKVSFDIFGDFPKLNSFPGTSTNFSGK